MNEVSEGGGITAGTLLRDARQAAGIHIAALAVALKVPVSKLEALESDNYEALPDTVFVRALASSMCRTLKLDPAPVLSLLPQIKSPRLATDSAGLNAPMKGRSGKSSSSSNAFSSSSTSRSVTLIVLALLVGALVLIFLPRQPTGDTLGSANAPAIAPSVADGVEQPSAPASAVSSSVSASPSVAGEPPAPASSAPGVAERVSTGSTAVAAAPDTTGSMPLSAARATTPATGALVLRARGQSWVQVKDATGVVALQRSLVAGESVSVAGPTPLTVVVGRADVTEALVHGKPFDLAAVSRENVARFEVK